MRRIFPRSLSCAVGFLLAAFCRDFGFEKTQHIDY
ncbi:hypothetical protein AFE_0885 [Acidithiobacillus ferrooxidans ATCC 23270]|uniref:Uncharacterized protein n=1 Tax=Acidithiobacillus ferrooxidans (strain ATCC 23270 / DSM 14882 / CIP 104768 / NCIMB 8455) TaxID=243159 RepID=B7J6U3_ACIF2|nr:hypothetical protein AFE_0885 [Acidithiobacillus ferrooxidans ATCC 23270]